MPNRLFRRPETHWTVPYGQATGGQATGGQVTRVVRFAALAGFFLLHSVAHTNAATLGLGLEPANNVEAQAQPDLDALKQKAQQNIERLRDVVSAGKLAESPAPANVVEELQLWESFDLVIAQRQSIREDLAAFQRSRKANEKGGVGEVVFPKSYLEYDEMRDLLASGKEQLEALRLELQAERSMLVGVKRSFEEAERLRRRSAEGLELSDSNEKIAFRDANLRADLESQTLKLRLDLHRDQVTLTAHRLEAAEQDVERLQEILAAHAGKFILSRVELDERLTRIEELEATMREQLVRVNTRMREAMRQRLSNPPTASNTAYEVAHEESQLLQQTLCEASFIKECWRRRLRLTAFEVPASEISAWLDETEQARQRISHISEKIRLRTSQRQQTLSTLGRSEFIEPDEEADPEVDAEAEELERIVEFYGNIQVLAASGERMYDRFIEDLEAQESKFSLAEWAQLAWSGIVAGWQYEITSIDDEPITVRKIVFGLILLITGYFVSRGLASLVAYRVLPKLGLSEAASSAFRTVLFYLLLTALVFVSLDVVNVPLTVFAFLGGAVAIGLGFGSQNLINNFISGLILLAERPIRVGDLVNVDGIDANVTLIGARSTRVRTGANLEILVPNSKFLENNVTNWTLSDTRVRTSVSVGVAYGSPVRNVIAEINQVIRNHEKVIQTPDPIVLFQDFADSALIFEAHFWIHMQRMMDGAKVRSEIRVALDDAFRDAGIVIAFPQRDVHIDMQSPIEVRLANPDGMTISDGMTIPDDRAESRMSCRLVSMIANPFVGRYGTLTARETRPM